MKVSERMTKEPITVDPSATAKDASERMKKENIGVVLVAEGDQLKGLVTDRQIATKVVAAGKDPAQTRVSEIMTENPVTASPDMIICDATEIIGENGFRRLPVVENDRLVGVLSEADITLHARNCDSCTENIFSEIEKAEK
ncbi:MAG: CBS domain-containing protein [Candidatus Methanoperedens sp.]|nr:CBS domain-containing protein [Candidatus Methanoperedens sp.]